MNEPSAGPYDSEPTQEIRSTAAGDSSAAAKARWREAVDGFPTANTTKELLTGPSARWAKARCGCLPDSLCAPARLENQPPSNCQFTTGRHSPPVGCAGHISVPWFLDDSVSSVPTSSVNCEWRVFSKTKDSENGLNQESSEPAVPVPPRCAPRWKPKATLPHLYWRGLGDLSRCWCGNPDVTPRMSYICRLDINNHRIGIGRRVNAVKT